MNRRDLLKVSALAGLAAATTAQAAAPASACATDGTPAQFIPKKPADPKPYENDIEKYPKCPYCGMDRKKFSHTRMLIQYSDDLSDGTCSLHCAAISLALNLDREPKAIWVGDAASDAEVKPLASVDKASFLVGSSIKGVMTRRSKMAYGTPEAAKAAQTANGGELANFDQALQAAYADMAEDVSMLRKMRAERRQKAAAEHQHH